MTRVWLVDDSPDVRAGVVQSFKSRPEGLELTRCFDSGRPALQAAMAGERWDVALVDLGLPDISGETVIRDMRPFWPKAAILAFTVRGDDNAIFSALRAGASGYLTKELSIADIIRAVVAAGRGEAPLSPAVGLRVLTSFWSPGPEDTRPADEGVDWRLTRREQEVLDLLCTGASYREVGTLLGIVEGTVQSHVKNLYGKLGVCSKAEAVRMAMGSGLTPGPTTKLHVP